MRRLFNFDEKPGAETRANGAATPVPAANGASHPATDAARTAVAEMMAEEIKSKEQRASDHAIHSQSTAQAQIGSARAERRHRRRVKISAPVRVRQMQMQHVSEFDLTMTSDVSREGILFETSRSSYARGQEVGVVFPYRPGPGEPVREQRGQVVRVVRATESRFGVAVAFLDGAPKYELVSSNGRPMFEADETPRSPASRSASRGKPLVLVVDADEEMRTVLRAEFTAQGYAVETVPDPSMAVALLRHRTPAALVCEAEPFVGVMPGGGDMSGYDLCVIVRRNAKLWRLPVILTTRTGLPSDFATAHALGATVCVAKPYDLARLANLLHMLAPVE